MEMASVSYTPDASEDKINPEYTRAPVCISVKVNSEKMAWSGSYQDPRMALL